MTKILLAAIVFLSLASPALAQTATEAQRFCAEVNLDREKCKVARYDCRFMMENLDGKTLDTIDQIKGCAPGRADNTLQQSRQYPDIGKLVCCMGSGLR